MLNSRFLTGIQPTGQLHLGNFISSILPWLRFQSKNFSLEIDTTIPSSALIKMPESFENYKSNLIKPELTFQIPKWGNDPESFPKESELNLLFIADLHSYSNKFKNPEIFQSNNKTLSSEAQLALTPSSKETFDLLTMLLACGIDPNKTILFVQSDIPAHSELFYLLSCVTPQHSLNNMIQYKEKKSKTSSVGLYTYPVLMSSDILLYSPQYVPVGDDQKQHLELTGILSRRFNQVLGYELLRMPEHVEWKSNNRLMSLANASEKMSKSMQSNKGKIELKDTLDQIAHKIQKAKTDSNSKITGNPKRLEIQNLLQLYSSLEGISMENTIE